VPFSFAWVIHAASTCSAPDMHGICCVRRAILCGEAPPRACPFDHRELWVEDRILDLASASPSPCTSNFLTPEKSRGCVGLKGTVPGGDSFRNPGYRTGLMGVQNSPQNLRPLAPGEKAS
jgi:hypothetical protein